MKLIAHTFPGVEIENPNQPHHQVGYDKYARRQQDSHIGHKGMGYFWDEVLPGCDGCVAMPFLDGRMGIGVNGEVQWFIKNERPCWFMPPAVVPQIPQEVLLELSKFILDPIHSDLFLVRRFTEEEATQALGQDPQLVVPHEETRLRTWRVYNCFFLSYEEAHLVTMPPPEYFYLKEKLAKKV